MSPEPPKSQLRCRYCGEILELGIDSMEARERGEDPYQQMRKHLQARRHLNDAFVKHTRNCRWLLDMLFFEAVNSPENWRKQIAAMVDFILKEPV